MLRWREPPQTNSKRSRYWLTKPLFKVLAFFNAGIGNMGLSILALTVCVKAIFFPLANKSYKSMSKMKALQPEIEKLRERYGDDRDAARRECSRLFQEAMKTPSPASVIVDHIEHVIGLVGIDHVGIGSDFDGIDSGPTGLEDVSTYPNLIEELLRRGLSEQDIRKICGENLLRVWADVERIADELRDS